MELNTLYQKMLFIRRVEEAIADRYSGQKMKCPVHLSIGQEATAVGVTHCLKNEDVVYSTHRCHAHYLAKGGDLKAMIAELFGKITGCAEGKGGSMHLVDPEVGMMGSSALVGGSIPLALGSALKFKLKKEPFVAVAFFGDGASEEGLLWESLNVAALKQLPVLFVCENNLYATYSHITARQANPKIAEKAAPFGVESFKVDGNDVEAVTHLVRGLVEEMRGASRPFFLECSTYRSRDHVGPNTDIEIGYRTQEEWDRWDAQCPLKKIEPRIDTNFKKQIESHINLQIESAFQFAEESLFPSPHHLETDVYA